MEKRSSASARAVAVTALVLAAVVLVVAIGGSLGGDSGSGGRGGTHPGHRAAQGRQAPATYEVQSGDTLVAISHRTDVPVRTIEALNPQVDPQILIAGEVLKLR